MLYRSWRPYEKVIIQDPTLNLSTDSTLRRPLTDMERAVTRIRQLFVDSEPMQRGVLHE
jgi:hypothetical protein